MASENVRTVFVSNMELSLRRTTDRNMDSPWIEGFLEVEKN